MMILSFLFSGSAVCSAYARNPANSNPQKTCDTPTTMRQLPGELFKPPGDKIWNQAGTTSCATSFLFRKTPSNIPNDQLHEKASFSQFSIFGPNVENSVALSDTRKS